MINLMPPELKNQITYARRNTKLRRYALAIVVGIAGIAAVVFAGQLYIDQSIDAYQKQVEQSRSILAAQKLDETQKHVQDISNSLKLVLQVLAREVLFSKLLQQVGAAMPAGSALQSLSISGVQGGIDLQAVAADYQTATQVQVNMQDPRNKIFEKADLVSVNCNSDNVVDPRYPCQVSIRALFASNNPFTFVQTKTTGTKQ
jgi:hypothetical protein